MQTGLSPADDAYTLVNNAINANFTSVAGQTMHFRWVA